uniref:Calmodulin-binding transcription activator 1 n=1 Tax=Pygocentrus nattereri TaxID=42514 RepID=A0AAR2JJ35_PYGNA
KACNHNNRQMKVFLPNKLLECLPRTSTLPKERLRWNTNEEIASYLISFDRHEEWLSCTLKTRPQNGSIFLYNRKKVQYRKDGYCWKKRKDGKTTREDHMKLKVQGTECLYGCYVHSSIVPTFHRRCYWLLQNPDIVLVHYLNVPSVEDSGKACGPVLCAVADRRDGLRWSRDELISQLKPMFHSMKWSCGNGAELSIEQLVQQILESQQTKPQPRTHTCLCNHGSPGVNIPHRCNSTKHRIISPKLPSRPSPYPALTEVQNLTNEGSGGGASREAGAGEASSGGAASERAPPSVRPGAALGRGVSPSQGVATLSLTLLQSPVIGGLLLTDRILSDASGALLRPPSPSPSLMAPPPPATDSPPAAGPTPSAPLPFDPDSFLNSPKQGQTYGGSSLTPPNQANNPSASCRTPPPSSSPQPPSLALSLSPISPPSSLSSLSPPTSTPSSSSLSPSLSFSLSPSCPARSLPPLCLDSSLGLDSLTRPLSPALGEQGTSSPLDAAHQRSASRYPDANGQALLIGRENGAPPSPLSLSQLQANQLLPSQHSSTNQQASHLSGSQLQLNQTIPKQLSPKQRQTNQPPAHAERAEFRPNEAQSDLLMTHPPRPPVRGLRHSLSQPALFTHSDTHTNTHSHAHTHAGNASPVRVKEEPSPPINATVLRELEPDETPMDTANSSDPTHPGGGETELSFDSTFPDLISELITEETSAPPAPAPPAFPVRYMVPPQPMPSTSFLPYSLLTPTHTLPHAQHSGPPEETPRLASITDFSPEWSYPEGGVKVLITGPWSEVSGRYSCMFDQSIVPASLIQPGVLRCYCPAHEAGLVALRVMKDMDAVSSSVLFEYRARNAASLPSSQLDWLSLDDNQFRMSILERLEQMERRMAEMANNNQQQHQQQQNHQQRLSRQQSLPSGPWFERRIINVCERMMMGGRWGGSGGERLTHSIRHRGMTLLHLAAAQGYTQLIHTLIQWRTVSADSLDLEQEVDPLNVDHFSCTPLMWACALGHQSAAVLLYRWSSVALGIPDSLGRLPLAVARSRGHTRLARCIEELHTFTQAQELTHTHTHTLSLDTSPPPQIPLSPLSTSPDTEQIIEATPERIKQEEFPREAESPLRERRDNPAIHDTMPWLAPYLDTVDRYTISNNIPKRSFVSQTPPFSAKHHLFPPSPLSALALQRLRPPSSAAWAEFLNASANGRMERDFALLTLTDSEQRELYEAARIIQNAFRRYKGRRLKEQQDMAAAVIQRCYRKYKQLTWIALKYALYKKMTQAAILIQSKFRSYYEQKKFQQSRRAAVLIQQYYRSYKEYERLKQGPRGANTLTTKIKGSFLTKKQDQAARKIMRFLRRCRHRYTQIVVVHLDSNDSVV